MRYQLKAVDGKPSIIWEDGVVQSKDTWAEVKELLEKTREANGG